MSLILVTALLTLSLVLLHKRRAPSDGALAGSLLTIGGTLMLGAVLSGDSGTILGSSAVAFYAPLGLGAALTAAGAFLTFTFVRQHRQEREVVMERMESLDAERA